LCRTLATPWFLIIFVQRTNMNEFEIQQLFQPYLTKDEKILWVGRPDPSVFLTKADIFLIPLSILMLIFALFWLGGVIISKAPIHNFRVSLSLDGTILSFRTIHLQILLTKENLLCRNEQKNSYPYGQQLATTIH